LTYLAETEVNWCQVGEQFNNDEIVNGFQNVVVYRSSKKMTQWSVRTAYAERLLQGLNDID
jgi:hypothetical protein